MASQLGSMHSQRQARRSLPRKRALHRAWQAPSNAAVCFPNPVGSQASQQPNLVHQHDRTGPEDSHGCKLGRSRIRVVGFWIWLDILAIFHSCRLIISTESLTGANIEVRHAKNESSMDRSGTRTSVVLHKFAKVPWLKLRRDNSVMDSDLKIAAVNTKPWPSRRSGQRKRDKHA